MNDPVKNYSLKEDQPVLKVENLSTEYFLPGGKTLKILNDISLPDIYPGKAMALIGESGSGKTTLALAILRLIMPWEGKITSGKAILRRKNGQLLDILSASDEILRQMRGDEITFIPQDAAAALNPVLKIYHQMEEAIKNLALSQHEKKSLIKTALENVKLSSERILNLYPHQLSGGQKQRVIIATALINSPAVIIADEPTSGLDVAVSEEILRILSSLKSQSSTDGPAPAFIFITHDIRTAAKFCDEAVILYGGKVCETAPLKSIIHSPRHPYTKGLINSILDIDKISSGIQPLEGVPPVFSSEMPIGCPFAPRCRHKMKICFKQTPHLVRINDETSVACFLYDKKNSL